jgi:hypothetical protein
MRGVLATVVDWNALGKVVGASLVLGVGVTGAFAFAILGVSRAGEMRRAGNTAAAGAFTVLAALAFAACAGALVLGIIVMTRKS